MPSNEIVRQAVELSAILDHDLEHRVLRVALKIGGVLCNLVIERLDPGPGSIIAVNSGQTKFQQSSGDVVTAWGIRLADVDARNRFIERLIQAELGSRGAHLLDHRLGAIAHGSLRVHALHQSGAIAGGIQRLHCLIIRLQRVLNRARPLDGEDLRHRFLHYLQLLVDPLLEDGRIDRRRPQMRSVLGGLGKSVRQDGHGQHHGWDDSVHLNKKTHAD